MADLFDGRDDVGVGATSTDVAVHRLFDVGVAGADILLRTATADMIWPEVQ
jgi:hypothetical protein